MTTLDQPTFRIQPLDADRAIRSCLCIFSLFVSYFAVRLAFSIGQFGAIFNDMLSGKPLPQATQFILETQYIWVGLSIVCSVLPFAFAFIARRTSYAVYGISASALLQALQVILLWTALTAPLFSIFSGMNGTQ